MGGRWLDSLEERAASVLPPEVLEYVVQGARGGVSVAEATAAWSSVRFRPRVLRDVTDVDTSCTVLGREAAVPFAVSPTTLQRAIHPDGELAMAAAVRDAGTVMVVSSNAGTRFADIGATGVRWWLQAYLPQDRKHALPLLERAVAGGAEAVVLTVDTPVVGTKYAAGERIVWDVVDPCFLQVNFEPGYADAEGADKATDLGEADLSWLAETTGLPVVVKGVLRPDDARRCVDAGVAAVWVSNHGGRQLDRAATTASSLPGVVAAVGGAAQVYVDGGIRSGLDVLAALSLGADAVFLGRSPLLSLVDGQPGVTRMLEELRVEVVEAMRLAGCRDLSDTRGLAVPDPSRGA
jgi:4-hydroxymandelate oxidase